MSDVNQLHHSPPPVTVLDCPTKTDHPTPTEVLPTDIAASELLAQLGHDYFTIEVSRSLSGAQTAPTTQRLIIDPHALAMSSPPLSEQRDFWEEVAATSDLASRLPMRPDSGAFGLASNPVAHAIATVSATYTLGPTEKRPAGSPGVVNFQPSSGAPKETSKASNEARRQFNDAEPGFAEALASLFDFEQIAELDGLDNLAPETFARARELAARSLLAASINRNSALKAAEGRRG